MSWLCSLVSDLQFVVQLINSSTCIWITASHSKDKYKKIMIQPCCTYNICMTYIQPWIFGTLKNAADIRMWETLFCVSFLFSFINFYIQHVFFLSLIRITVWVLSLNRVVGFESRASCNMNHYSFDDCLLLIYQFFLGNLWYQGKLGPSLQCCRLCWSTSAGDQPYVSPTGLEKIQGGFVIKKDHSFFLSFSFPINIFLII